MIGGIVVSMISMYIVSISPKYNQQVKYMKEMFGTFIDFSQDLNGNESITNKPC